MPSKVAGRHGGDAARRQWVLNLHFTLCAARTAILTLHSAFATSIITILAALRTTRARQIEQADDCHAMPFITISMIDIRVST